jgi:D-sedoheptulose 7-phosphate isomerase
MIQEVMAKLSATQVSEAMRGVVSTCVRDSIATKQTLLEDPNYLSLVAEIGCVLADAIRQGGKVFFFGNGGSAADAQHLAAEFTGRFLIERRPLPGLALTVNTSSLTAIGNDYSFDLVFARQIEALGKPGDVAIGISTSGNSPNVLRAIEVARKLQMATVGLTGRGGKLASAAEYCIRIPSDSTPRIQEAHILTGHILCEIVDCQLFGSGEQNR